MEIKDPFTLHVTSYLSDQSLHQIVWKYFHKNCCSNWNICGVHLLVGIDQVCSGCWPSANSNVVSWDDWRMEMTKVNIGAGTTPTWYQPHCQCIVSGPWLLGHHLAASQMSSLADYPHLLTSSIWCLKTLGVASHLRVRKINIHTKLAYLCANKEEKMEVLRPLFPGALQ